MRLPQTHGYFWVERDNEIIDYDFPQYHRLRMKFGATDIHCYLRAPPKVEEAMIRLFRRVTMRAFDCDTWDDMMVEFLLVAKMTGNADGPTFHRCWTNAIQEVYHNGGQIRFGSMGFKRKDGTYHWYYADDQCKDMADYLI
jgi:hypothetical protein